MAATKREHGDCQRKAEIKKITKAICPSKLRKYIQVQLEALSASEMSNSAQNVQELTATSEQRGRAPQLSKATTVENR